MRIKFNGREYANIDAMPPDVRKAYEIAMRLMTRQHTPEDLAEARRMGMKVRSQISIGGQVYDSVEDLPPHLRQRVAELAARSTQPSLFSIPRIKSFFRQLLGKITSARP